MQSHLPPNVMAIQAITAVPTILEAVAAITGLRFVCVAHVTCDSWTTCAVLDNLNFGLQPGDGLDITTTLCETVRDSGKMIVIDHVSEDQQYRDHHTPKMYGFESYISVPIFRTNGDYFGTLCGLDPLPVKLSTTATTSSMTMFAQLIALQLNNESILATTNEALLGERETAELREQFIAVLGHDVRNPLGAILNGTKLLSMMPDIGAKATTVIYRIQRSAQRIEGLVNDVVDFTRGRMGGGIGLELNHENGITYLLEQVVAELSYSYPDRTIEAAIANNLVLVCDSGRIGQLLSNLLKNALVHGDPSKPIKVNASTTDGVFTLAVSNGGSALSETVIGQLFKPFWRSPGQSASEGLGLGLFIVSEIAHAHAGQIRVDSSDECTSFIFTMKSAEFIERRQIELPRSNFNERRR